MAQKSPKPEPAGKAAKRRRDAALSLADYRLLAEFRHRLARFLAFSEKAAQDAGLAPRQHQALLAIKGFPDGPVTVGDLAERLGVRHHSAVGLVDRLVAAGFVRRQADAADGRKIILSLTAAGDKILEGLSAIHREELRRITPLLAPVLAQLGGE